MCWNISMLSIAVWQKAMNALGGIVGVIGRVLLLQRGVRRVGPICIRDKFGSQLVWSMQDNLQVKKGVKLAFLEYAFGAEDQICQIVLVISSKKHFTLDARCCHNPFTKKDYTEDESWCHDNGDWKGKGGQGGWWRLVRAFHFRNHETQLARAWQAAHHLKQNIENTSAETSSRNDF